MRSRRASSPRAAPLPFLGTGVNASETGSVRPHFVLEQPRVDTCIEEYEEDAVSAL